MSAPGPRTHPTTDAPDGTDIRADVRAWLAGAPPIREMLGDLLTLRSLPASLVQNAALDMVETIVGSHPDVGRDRWVPDWDAIAGLASPVDSQLLHIPLVERDPAYAEVLDEIETVVYTLRRGDGPTVMLNGHVDVVPADADDWTGSPFVPHERDGLMIGRGAMDMKAGIVAAALAFRYLAETWSGPGTVLFAVVPEEETGGNGTLATMHRGYVPDAAVFTEPTDLQVVHRHVGIQAFDIDVTGRSGGMLRRSWGTSATPTIARIAVALDQLEQARTATAHRAGGYSDDDLPGFVNVTMTSGDWLATRAGHGHLEGLMGVLPDETQDQAEAALQEAVRRVAEPDGLPVTVRVRPGGHRGGELAADHPLVVAFADDLAASGCPGARTRAGTMVCDAKIVQGGGWAPSVVLGPVGGNLHSADEWVDLASVSMCVELVVRGVLRFLARPVTATR
ncbi:M20/M25/M40 family metallo-hydrolase [Pseudonocardia spinosispora]|uniref:M20/M25/M40 family metallo-hydrolase n=1 Tax=Pseudonocardia spinosispora TaxID=103441 RepID=UPI0004080701|nr:M20/M25/M40 family metallo-hydrolase [Pseudonocardia spinosispora]